MFDAIVVGARCAGSPTAMLLARQGYRLLLVDRATFPSDTISTHYTWQLGLACLKRWGLLDRVLDTGCPLFTDVGLDLGVFQLTGKHGAVDGISGVICPRRTIFDKILLDAAGEAGVEVREAFSVTGLTWSDGRVTGIRGHGQDGKEIEERARLVIGADGRNSLVARAVNAPEYSSRPPLTCGYYAYWNVPAHPSAVHMLPRRVVITFPTHDGLTVVYVTCPCADYDSVRSDLEGFMFGLIQQVGSLKDLFRPQDRVSPVMGMRDQPNYFRQSHGEGWALGGDAGYLKDPIIAQGMSDALRSAEWLADAAHAGLSGSRPINDALADYQRIRDERLMPMFHLSCEMATLEPPPPEVQSLFGALRNNAVERDRYFAVLAGIVPVAEFFAPANVQRIVAGGS